MLLLGSHLQLSAQNLEILWTNPQPNAVGISQETSIGLVFNELLDNASTIGSVSAWGRWTGPIEVSTFTFPESEEIIIAFITPLIAGDLLTLSLSKQAKAASGNELAHTYTWQYWVKTTGGTLTQNLVKTIPLRDDSEGLLQTYGAYAGDLNQDGYSDLTVVNETSDDLRILINDGTGDFNDFEIIEMGMGTPSPNEGADFNKDGLIDLAVSTAHNNELRVLFGDGEGSFPSMQTYETGNAARGLAVMDLNGDSWDDIVISNRHDSNVDFFINNGDATFSRSSIDPLGEGETSLATADVNNDGIMDAYIGYYTSQEIGVLLGDGNGNLELSEKIAVLGQPWMLAAGDLNGDGIPDVASANASGDVSVVAFGDGEGGFLEGIDYYNDPNSGFPLAMDLADLDGDNDLDMVTSNYSSSTFLVYENDGDGKFELSSTLTAPNKASCAILHDRDNDGDVDITATDEGDDVILIFENDATTLTPFVVKSDFKTSTYPNPAKEQLIFKYTLEENIAVHIELYDLKGSIIEYRSIAKAIGEQNIIIPLKNTLTNGIYFYKVTANNLTSSGKILVKR